MAPWMPARRPALPRRNNRPRCGVDLRARVARAEAARPRFASLAMALTRACSASPGRAPSRKGCLAAVVIAAHRA
eukprot:11198831-Lingulodinium_polyedra.AAC.1